MNSLENLGKPGRLNWLSGTGVMSLIIIGFMATTASAFWTFTKSGEPNVQTIEPAATPAESALICECTLEIQPPCVN